MPYIESPTFGVLVPEKYEFVRIELTTRIILVSHTVLILRRASWMSQKYNFSRPANYCVLMRC